MERTAADRQSELLDVQLLDVFAQIEALLRLGREVQREALRVRGLPMPVSVPQRKAAGQRIRAHLAVERGRRGGLKGGSARASALSPEKRRAIAKKAAVARWSKSYVGGA